MAKWKNSRFLHNACIVRLESLDKFVADGVGSRGGRCRYGGGGFMGWNQVIGIRPLGMIDAKFRRETTTEGEIDHIPRELTGFPTKTWALRDHHQRRVTPIHAKSWYCPASASLHGVLGMVWP